MRTSVMPHIVCSLVAALLGQGCGGGDRSDAAGGDQGGGGGEGEGEGEGEAGGEGGGEGGDEGAGEGGGAGDPGPGEVTLAITHTVDDAPVVLGADQTIDGATVRFTALRYSQPTPAWTTSAASCRSAWTWTGVGDRASSS